MIPWNKGSALSWEIQEGTCLLQRLRTTGPETSFVFTCLTQSQTMLFDEAKNLFSKNGTFLVAQWIKIYQPRQWSQVQSLVQEDSTCHGATKPICYNYWTSILKPTSHNYWSPCTCAWGLCPTTREATARNPHTAMKSSPSLLQLEKACMRQQRRSANHPSCFQEGGGLIRLFTLVPKVSPLSHHHPCYPGLYLC